MKKKTETLDTKELLRRGKKRRGFRDNMEFLLMALPGIISVIIFCYLPMFGIIVSFKNFNPNKGIFGSEWNGLDNFEFFFTSPDAPRVIRNTVLYSIDFMFVIMFFALILAFMFYYLKNRIALKIYNTIAILPRFISAVLIAFIVYAFLNPVSGVLNRFIGMFGVEPIDWYAKPGAWPFILTLLEVWKSIGMKSILYYATLMSIDEALFEAAELDGASRFQQTLHVALPHLAGIISIQLILDFGGLFSGDFGLFYQTTRDVGILYPTTDIINTYTFRALTQGNMSISSAIGLVQSILGLIMVTGVNMIVRKISPEHSFF